MATKQTIDPRAPIVGEWNRMPRYECPFCGWDTLDETAMTDHLDPARGMHPDFGADAPPDTPEPFTREERAELESLRAEVVDLRQQALDTQIAAEKAQKAAERAKAHASTSQEE